MKLEGFSVPPPAENTFLGIRMLCGLSSLQSNLRKRDPVPQAPETLQGPHARIRALPVLERETCPQEAYGHSILQVPLSFPIHWPLCVRSPPLLLAWLVASVLHDPQELSALPSLHGHLNHVSYLPSPSRCSWWPHLT